MARDILINNEFSMDYIECNKDRRAQTLDVEKKSDIALKDVERTNDGLLNVVRKVLIEHRVLVHLAELSFRQLTKV